MSRTMVEGMESRILEVEAAKSEIERSLQLSQIAATETSETLQNTIDEKVYEITSLKQKLQIETENNNQKCAQIDQLKSRDESLSEQNNEPRLALATHQQIVGADRLVYVASRYEVSPMFEVEKSVKSPATIAFKHHQKSETPDPKHQIPKAACGHNQSRENSP